ncbi:MAG: hypothetical protein JNG86_18185, partial [Verrucomicrobiaceae bacterium]|nr:hypothetical protein [Verrucomicrobiaceae bacterium]
KDIAVDDEEWSRLLDEKQPVPVEWRNALYVEWFSAADGRVVIESTDFEMQITDFTWEMDEAEEQAQQLMNQHAMRDWLATVIQRPERRGEDGDARDENAFTEAAWEESMKLSDRVNTAHMEALDKYGDDDDDESRVAFVMGWDHLLDAMADDSAHDGRVTARGAAFDGTAEDDDDPEDAGEEWKITSDDDFDDSDDDEEDMDAGERGEEPDFEAWMEQRKERRHPLVKKGSDLITRILKDLKDVTADDEGEEDEDLDTPLERFLSNAMSISGKLAGALGSPDYAEGMEAGHTLAILKRCLNWSNEALAGLNDLLADPHWETRHTLFSEYKRDLHDIRDAITDLRHEIRQANPGV